MRISAACRNEGPSNSLCTDRHPPPTRHRGPLPPASSSASCSSSPASPSALNCGPTCAPCSVVLHDPPGPCTCTACTGLLDPWASLRPPPVSASHPVMLPVPTAPGIPFLSPLPASAAPHSSPTWPQDSWGGSCPPLTACSLTHSPVHPLARLRAVRAPGRSLCPHPLLPVWRPHPAWQTWYGLSEALPQPRRSRNLTKQPSLYSLRQPYHNDTPW